MNERYTYYANLFSDVPKPLAFLDKDYLDQNIKDIIRRNPHKKMRIASKSIRCRKVIEYIFSQSSQFEGIMSFTGPETVFLLENGFDNILLGYPIIDKKSINRLCGYIKDGKKVVFMADLPQHLELINQAAKEKNIVAKVCVDIDMSSKFPFLYFGVYRSSINSVEKLKVFTEAVKDFSNIKLIGLMGYESQIAGLGDNTPNDGLKNTLIKFLKTKSVSELRKRRKQAVDLLNQEGFEISIVNAGGTGSLESSSEEDWVTEITVGSGFYSSHLFDNYSLFKHLPAVAYMLDITRNPKGNIYTAAGGGYTASGALDLNKLPKPYLPEGIKWFKNEGVGEVQTPFTYKGDINLKIGDLVILRHSKAGEVCERFNELYLVSNGRILDQYLTYRGEGKCFM